MTFSIVARSADGTCWGVAVASKFLGAGAVVPAARAVAGAVATQSLINLRYLPDGRTPLEQGVAAEEGVAQLTRADDLRASRQVDVVDAAGGSASFTRGDCIPWAGSAAGPDHTAQGNCLAGPEVVQEMSRGSRRATTPPRWPDGCSPRCASGARRVATAAAGRAPGCSWSPPPPTAVRTRHGAVARITTCAKGPT